MIEYIGKEGRQFNFIDEILEEFGKNWDFRKTRLPSALLEQISLNSDLVFDVLHYLHAVEYSSKDVKLCLLNAILIECFNQILYGIDRGDGAAVAKNVEVQKLLYKIYISSDVGKRMFLGEALHEAGLPVNFELEEYSKQDSNVAHIDAPDIMPRLPELLDILRREHGFSTAYELYDLIIPHLKIQSKDVQISIIYELLKSNKSIVHDTGVLMLLHGNANIRQHVVSMMMTMAKDKLLNAIDLRRIIVIRNWLPSSEQGNVDVLIKAIRISGVEPARHMPTKITKISAAALDGAGVQGIFFEAKTQGRRISGGFLLKIDVGIRDPWVAHKTKKGVIEGICSQSTDLEFKQVTMAYVNNVVGHFLSIAKTKKNVPSPFFLEIQELFGANDWQPQLLNIASEIARIKEISNINSDDAEFISASVKRSEKWLLNEKFTRSWFEVGEKVRDAVDGFANTILNLDKEDIDFNRISTEAIMQPAILEKWKTILLIMLLWSRSKIMEGEYWKDFLVSLEQIESGVELHKIPVILHVVMGTVRCVMMHGGAYLDGKNSGALLKK